MIQVSEVTGQGLARVQLNRPQKLNALTLEMWGQMARVFRHLSDRPDIRVILVEGGGGRAFCVGADIEEFQATRGNRKLALSYAAAVRTAIQAIERCSHPTVAAIKGHCVGGGVEIAAACDMRLASDDSLFGIPIRKLGLTVDYSELAALIRLVGQSNALEILFEGRIFPAEEALAKGLINRILPTADFEEEVDAATERIATGAPIVARWHKQMVRRLSDPTPLTDDERVAPFSVFDTEDYRRGIRAFLDKSDPVFVGR